MKRIIEQIKTESESADYCCDECAKLLSNAIIGFIEDAFESLPNPTDEGWWWVNYGEGWQAVLLRLNASNKLYYKSEIPTNTYKTRIYADRYEGKWCRAIMPESEVEDGKKKRKITVSSRKTKRGTHFHVYIPKQFIDKPMITKEFQENIELQMKDVAKQMTNGIESEG